MKTTLTRYDVRALTGMGNSTLERKMAEEGFPKPGKDGTWSRADIEAWNRRAAPVEVFENAEDLATETPDEQPETRRRRRHATDETA